MVVDLSQLKKYEDLSLSQWIAIGKKLGGLEKIIGLLQGDLEAGVRKAEKALFDRHGRRIPRDLKAEVCDAGPNFMFDPLALSIEQSAERMVRVEKYLGINLCMTSDGFCQRGISLLKALETNKQISNIMRGVWLPIVLPKLDDNYIYIGEALENWINAAGKSYSEIFPGRRFHNHRQGDLADQVRIASGSQQQLLAKMTEHTVVGIYFPNPLQGFSVEAQREQMATLPEGFVLSAFDTVMAMIMYPDVLARGNQTPRLDLSAFSWNNPASSLFFSPRDSEMHLADSSCLYDALNSFSGSLLFIG